MSCMFVTKQAKKENEYETIEVAGIKIIPSRKKPYNIYYI